MNGPTAGYAKTCFGAGHKPSVTAPSATEDFVKDGTAVFLAAMGPASSAKNVVHNHRDRRWCEIGGRKLWRGKVAAYRAVPHASFLGNGHSDLGYRTPAEARAGMEGIDMRAAA